MQKGFTKNLAGFWLAPDASMSQQRSGPRAPIDITRDGPGGVSENEPTRREGVTRESDCAEEVMGQRGLIQNLTGRFRDGPAQDQGKRKDQIVIDLAEGPSVLENEPMQVCIICGR